MSERDFRGVWIPAEIWLAEDLSLAEKCLLVEIDSLDCSPRHCFKSNEKLALFLGCSVPTVTRGVRKLASKGLVSFEIEKTPTGSSRVIKSLIKMIRPPNQNDDTPPNQNDEHSILPLLGDMSNTDEGNTPLPPQGEQRKLTKIDMLSSQVLAYLNEKTGKAPGRGFDTMNRTGFAGWVKAGHTLEDFKMVIDYCFDQWNEKPDLRQYIRPSTLFNGKFKERLLAAEEGFISRPMTDEQRLAIIEANRARLRAQA